MLIQSNHTLVESIRCKIDNGDVSKKTVKKITAKLESAKNTADLMSSGALRELRVEIDQVKGEKAQRKLHDALDKFERKNMHLRVECQITLLNMSLKNCIKHLVSDSHVSRELTSQVGELATYGHTNAEERESCYKALNQANSLANKRDIEGLKKVLNEAVLNIYN